MKPYTTLYDDVLPELPGLEPSLALHHIKRVCVDFYKRSQYARTTLPVIDVTTNVALVPVVHSDPTNFEISRILRVEFEGVPLDPVTEDWLNQNTTAWTANTGASSPYSWRTQQGRVKWYTQDATDSILLVAVPDHTSVGGLLVTVADMPIYAGGGIHDTVYNRFIDAIAAGIKSKLMLMSGKPWSNPGAGSMYHALYESEIGAAAAIATRNYGRAPLRTRAWA